MYFAALLFFGSVLNCVSSLTVNIEPKKAHVRPNETITIMCKADAHLSGCQFAWKNHLRQGAIMDFSLGPASQTISAGGPGEDISSFSYSGSGLENGECGLSIVISRWGSRIIGCRVREATGGWVYADLGIQVDGQQKFSLVADPLEAVVKEGGDVDITCQSNEPLKDCTISVPGISLVRFNRGHDSEQTPQMRYFGTGLEHGQCGVTLRSVTDDTNGRLICAAKPLEGKGYELSTITVIVAKAPTFVELEIEKNPIPNGEKLQASCTVRDSRPPPTISWYLGGEKIREDQMDDSFPSVDWAWKNLTRTVIQNISRPVTSDDNGKELRCEVEHVALTNRLAQAQVLSVQAPPSCLPLKSSSLEIKCVLNGKQTSCSEPSLPGTTATFRCKTGYLISNPHPGYSSITCREDGRWNKLIYECVLDCGKRNVKGGDTLISHGDNAEVGEFPWHVAIYQKIGNSHIHICGGTLISPSLVVSAAHCFWNNQMTQKNNASLYAIAAGKHYREWNVVELVPPQTRDVTDIFIKDRYKGRETNFALDIALLRLSSPVVIEKNVNVICIDWDNEREKIVLFDGNNGTVPGWGFTETGQQSEVLKVVNLPYISFHPCYRALPLVTRPILTQDKFCAGYVNKNISVCRGDSGGGLVFYDDRTERYYLRGIVSVAFKPFGNKDICFAQLYTAFTTFSNFIPWVEAHNY